MSSVTIVGSGVIGTATGKGFARLGEEVTFVDINPSRLQKLKEGGYKAVNPEEMDLTDVDFVLVCVPTPTEGDCFVVDYIQKATEQIGIALTRALAKGPEKYRVVAVRSTVLPGTVEGLVIPTLERYTGAKVCSDFGVCHNPEYMRAESSEEDFLDPWIIVIGQNSPRDGDLLEALYKKHFSCPIYRAPVLATELQKYTHNIFNAVKISFFNEWRLVCERLGVDADEVFSLVAESAEGMRNPAYGTRDLGAFDGNCLPKDSEAFLSFAKDLRVEMPVLEAAIELNKKIAQGFNVQKVKEKG